MHKDLKADYIIANPPFNDSDWSGELLRDDARWSVLGQKLPPPPNNANYAWIQHFLYHLAPSGQAGFVLAKGSLTTKTSNEGDIRKAMVENDLIDCIVNLPTKLFLNTQIPACLWFICRNKSGKPSSGATHHLLPVGEGHYRGGFDFSGQLELARMLRNNATPAEQLFWELVRDRRFLGLKFRRQHQIGAYIADFYCDEKKLVVELDGGVHNEPTRIKIDHKRDAYMKSLGITVFRLSNEQLMRNPEKVLTSIASAVSPSPFGRGEGVRVNESRNRKGEMLFIDARNMGFLINRKNRELSDDDIALIATTYHNWRTGEGKYKDVQGFCKSATLNEVKALNYVLTPGRYIGLPDDEDDFNYEERIIKLKAELHQQMRDEIKLNEIINRNLEKIRLQ
jgi:Type I restriction-modification system methyltransferase subunit